MRHRAAVVGAVLLLASSFALPARSSPTPATSPNIKHTAVVAVIDTGINPYHVAFRDNSVRARRHPSTYIPGFPKSAEALPITLNEKDFWTAVNKDCKLWNKVKTGKLYWFPGTKIIGGITFDQLGPPMNCEAKTFSGGRIIDGGAHGTMTASRAVGNGYGACSDCRVVAIQGFENEAVKWAADNNSWIDAQSNSWGPFLPLWVPSGDGAGLTNGPEFVKTVEDAAQKHLSFWASGNGTLTRFGVVGHPTPIDPRMTPSIVMVGGHDSGYVNLWPDFPPHVVSDSCNCWAAYHDQIDKSADTVGSGTSSATPFAAGGAGNILIAARTILGDTSTGVTKKVVARGPAGLVKKGPLKDGEFTLAEWNEVLFKTATARPKAQDEDGPPCFTGLYGPLPVMWEQVPEGYPEYVHIGYGAVDTPAMRLAVKVLSGTADLPDRTDTDRYFDADRPIREELHQIFRG